MRPAAPARPDIHARITQQIVSQLEAGVRPWTRPWSHSASVSRPLRHDGTPYNGINVVLLWGEAADRGYTRSTWMTFRQALALGAHVRKGERGATVVYANQIVRDETDDVLLDILATTISPELIPQTAEGESQSTEGKIGPYELHDFWIYYLTRFGLRPSKIAFLALHAWRDTAAGHWPPGFPDEQKRAYPIGAIRSWLEVFLQRFFANQFKRSALPNGPKVTTGGSLSPRGDWRMPSDAHGQVWIDELHRNVPEVLDPASDDIPTKEPKASPVGGKPIVR